MRYIGSKGNCAGIARVINSFLGPGDSYYEPFLGSGKVMEKVRCGRRYGSDRDRHIVTLLRAVQAGWRPPDTLPEAEWKVWKQRAKDPKGRNHPMIAFAGYGCSFAGDFHSGYARDSKGTDYVKQARNTLLRQRPFLNGVEFQVQDYRDGFWGVGHPTVTYNDPPYAATCEVGMATRDGQFDSKEFWDWAWEQSRHGIVLVSEYDCPFKRREVNVLWEMKSKKGVRFKDGRAKTERLFGLGLARAGWWSHTTGAMKHA